MRKFKDFDSKLIEIVSLFPRDPDKAWSRLRTIHGMYKAHNQRQLAQYQAENRRQLAQNIRRLNELSKGLFNRSTK